MNFNSRETYLAARAQWVVDYRQLSANIRRERGAYVEGQRAAGKLSFNKESYGSESNRAYFAAHHAFATSYSNLLALRKKANEALEELHAAKAEAGRQWEASRPRPT